VAASCEDDAVAECIMVCLEEATGHAETHCELTLSCVGIHAAIDHGTLDFAAVTPFSHGALVEFKTGGNRVPHPEHNLQTITQALALADEYGLSRVDTTIVQPACGEPLRWTWYAEDFPRLRLHLQQLVDACLVPFAPRTPGPAQCRYCRAAVTCPALLAVVNESDFDTAPEEMSAAEIGRILGSAELAKLWGGRVKGMAHTIAEAGGDIPGWRAFRKRGNRVWIDGVDEARLKALGAELDKPTDDLLRTKTTCKLVTPAQLMGKPWGKSKAVREALEPLYFQKPGALKLVRQEVANV
jgi:hypothetical protein